MRNRLKAKLWSLAEVIFVVTVVVVLGWVGCWWLWKLIDRWS